MTNTNAINLNTTSNPTQIIVRFAPSPTGYMHIGNARTAIFNYLLAKHYKGTILLRIEDTDKERSTSEAINVIFQGLDFLGIHYDSEPILQSKNQHIHYQYAQKLLTSGHAYLDSEGVTRFKVPQTTISFTDKIYGPLTIHGKDIEDFALLRSDSTPTYNLAVIVDDYTSNVNYIIRGCDHTTNTFKQLLLIDALQFPRPQYAHLPLIHDSQGRKMSKRNNNSQSQPLSIIIQSTTSPIINPPHIMLSYIPLESCVSVVDFIQAGILPQALFNYLMRLGWACGDEEFIPFDKAVEIFDESGFNKSAARFDSQKLLNLNSKYMRFLDNHIILQSVHKLLSCQSSNPTSCTNTIFNWKRFTHGLDTLKIRCKTLIELIDMGRIYLNDTINQTDINLLISDKYLLSQEHIDKLIVFLQTTPLDQDVQQKCKDFCTIHNISFPTLAGWLRIKLTGLANSPSAFDIMQVLGHDLTITRLT